MINKRNKIYMRQQGFSLVEVMVGLIIGLLATLVIMQVFSTFEGQKRSTSGSADAQTNGSIALMNIQRNVQMAGYGLPLPMANPEFNALRCNTFPDFTDPVSGRITNLFPIIIQDGGAGSDSLTVRYSTNAMGGLPTEITDSTNPATTGLVVESTMGCNIDADTDNDDIALVQKGTTCDMAMIDTIAGSAPPSGGAPTPQRVVLSVLPPTNPSALVPGGAPADASKITCMGNWQNYTFQVVNNELRLNGQPIVSEVVNMQVQYGVSDSAGDNNVTDWVNATAGGIWNNPNVATRNRIKAVRVAIVLRNGLLEKTNVTDGGTGTAPAPVSWTTPLNGSAAPVVDLSADANWRRYRYRTFETIIPFRNMLWSKDAVS